MRCAGVVVLLRGALGVVLDVVGVLLVLVGLLVVVLFELELLSADAPVVPIATSAAARMNTVALVMSSPISSPMPAEFADGASQRS